MQYRILMTTLALAMSVPSMATQAAEVGSSWSAKAVSLSSGRSLTDGPNYSFHWVGGFAAAPTPLLAMVSAAHVNGDIAGVGDDLGNTSMFADITPIDLVTAIAPIAPSAGAWSLGATPNRVTRSAASQASITSTAGLSADSKGYATLLAAVGVVGFLAFKRGGAQSRY